MPSKRANRYGTLAEKRAAEKYRLRRDGAHTSWCDAVAADGTPHEIKAARVRADGRNGRFRVFKTPHEQLASEGGRYVFVAYRPCGNGLTVLQMRRLAASALPVSTWFDGGHRDSLEAKIEVSDVF